jgi:hypothetical protein
MVSGRSITFRIGILSPEFQRRIWTTPRIFIYDSKQACLSRQLTAGICDLFTEDKRQSFEKGIQDQRARARCRRLEPGQQKTPFQADHNTGLLRGKTSAVDNRKRSGIRNHRFQSHPVGASEKVSSQSTPQPYRVFLSRKKELSLHLVKCRGFPIAKINPHPPGFLTQSGNEACTRLIPRNLPVNPNNVVPNNHNAACGGISDEGGARS